VYENFEKLHSEIFYSFKPFEKIMNKSGREGSSPPFPPDRIVEKYLLSLVDYNISCLGGIVRLQGSKSVVPIIRSAVECSSKIWFLTDPSQTPDIRYQRGVGTLKEWNVKTKHITHELLISPDVFDAVSSVLDAEPNSKFIDHSSMLNDFFKRFQIFSNDKGMEQFYHLISSCSHGLPGVAVPYTERESEKDLIICFASFLRSYACLFKIYGLRPSTELKDQTSNLIKIDNQKFEPWENL